MFVKGQGVLTVQSRLAELFQFVMVPGVNFVVAALAGVPFVICI